MRIVCIHLLDDFSGASNVCAQAIDAMKAGGHEVQAIVGGADTGFVRRSHLARSIGYRYTPSPALRLVRFAVAQASIFTSVIASCLRWKADVVYVSTMLPVGAMLAGALCGRPVVTHVHEVGLGSRRLFALVRACTLRWSDVVVCVSDFVARSLPVPLHQARVVHNSLVAASWDHAARIAAARLDAASAEPTPFTVAMACSLKWYKGIDSFLALAAEFDGDARIAFVLVLNCDATDLERFMCDQSLTANVRVEHRPPSVLAIFAHAHLVVNLSHPEGWIETFGLTLLEAMACGVPVVAPPVGGCIEVVENDRGGWHIASRDTVALARLVRRLHDDREMWLGAARAARCSALRFAPERFRQHLNDALPAPR